MDTVRDAMARSVWSALGQAVGMGLYRRYLRSGGGRGVQWWVVNVAMDTLIGFGALGASHLLQESLLTQANLQGSLLRAEGLDLALLGGSQLLVHGPSDAFASMASHLAWDASGVSLPIQNFVSTQVGLFFPLSEEGGVDPPLAPDGGDPP